MPIIDLVDRDVEQYALSHTTAPDDRLAALISETSEKAAVPLMMSGLAEMRLLEALIVISGARRVLEVGTFTGLGALAMAAVLADDARLITIEHDEETAAIARRFFDTSPDKAKIDLIVGDAREEVERLEGPFDLVYLDAWKDDYQHYYDTLLPKLAPNGLMLADNVLWRGRVLEPTDDDGETRALVRFNQAVTDDERVVNALLTVGDGMTLIRKA